MNTLLGQFTARLELLGSEKVDQVYFRSDEFQSLLYLLLDRLHTAHDTEKLRIFGNALGNSGNVDFQDDPKEDYVRVLRDFSLKELKVLDSEHLKGWSPHLPTNNIEYGAEILVSLFRLQGMVLVLGQIQAERG